MDFTKFNKVSVTFKNAKKDLPFKTINELQTDVIYRVHALLPVNSKFGLRYFAILEHNNEWCNFDLPTNQNETCKAIYADKDAVDSINEGKCGIVLSRYYSKKYNKDCVGIAWRNIPALSVDK